MIGPYFNQLEDSILEFQDLKSFSALLQKLKGMGFTLEFHVHSISPLPLELFSLNLFKC